MVLSGCLDPEEEEGEGLEEEKKEEVSETGAEVRELKNPGEAAVPRAEEEEGGKGGWVGVGWEGVCVPWSTPLSTSCVSVGLDVNHPVKNITVRRLF
jgi:hypothetical protein